jgi:hypothetical protein
MDRGFIRVSQRGELQWSVISGPRAIALLTFKLKLHAVAYARAISLSSEITLFVDNEFGMPVRQGRETLNYPRVLN